MEKCKKREQFLDWAKKEKWQVRRRNSEGVKLPSSVTARHQVPQAYLEFLAAVKCCATPEATAWFLCQEDYDDNPDLLFRWNELERLSIAAAEDQGDHARKERIAAWWDGALPFFVSVGAGYAFFAFDTKRDPGAVLYGFEPRFEEAQKVADDLDGFLALLMSGEIELAE